MILEYFEEINGTDLFFELRAVVENYVLAVLRQFRQRYADVSAGEVGDHGGGEEEDVVFGVLVTVPALLAEGVAVVLDDLVYLPLLLLVQHYHPVAKDRLHPALLQKVFDVPPGLGCQHHHVVTVDYSFVFQDVHCLLVEQLVEGDHSVQHV